MNGGWIEGTGQHSGGWMTPVQVGGGQGHSKGLGLVFWVILRKIKKPGTRQWTRVGGAGLVNWSHKIIVMEPKSIVVPDLGSNTTT